MPSLEADLNQGFGYLQAGHSKLAHSLFQTLLKTHPNSAYVWCGWGQSLESRHQYKEALNAYAKALEIQPDEPEFINNQAILWQKMGRTDLALNAFKLLNALTPSSYGAYNLALSYQALGDISQAISSLKEALQYSQDLNTYQLLATLQFQTRQYPQALESYHYLIKHIAKNAFFYFMVGQIYELSYQNKQALNYYKQAVIADPECHMAHLAQISAHIPHEHDLALTHAQKCAQKFGLIEYHLCELSLLPSAIAGSKKQLLQERQTLEEKISILEKAKPSDYKNLKATDYTLSTPPIYINFYLAYQGFNDKNIKGRLAKIYQHYFAIPQAKINPAQEKRIGFISCFFHNHSITHCYYKLMRAFKRAGFKVSIFYLHLSQYHEDGMLSQLKNEFEDYHALAAKDLRSIREALTDSNLDILIYTDIGMDPVTYHLAMGRFAKHQLLMPGHPVTSGCHEIDYFVTPDLMELPHAQEHYSEQLVRLPGVPTDYIKPQLPQDWGSRADLDLPDGTLYTCPMTLFKLHPDFDLVLKEILETDPEGHILLFKYKGMHPLLEARFREVMSDKICQRIHFLPWQPPENLLRIIYHSGVILDPLHFGGGNTCYLTFAVGTPMVSCPTEFMRSRGAFALYQIMGMHDEVIVGSAAHYAQQAIRIAQNPTLREQLKSQILKQNHTLFGDKTHNLALIQFCKDLLESPTDH